MNNVATSDVLLAIVSLVLATFITRAGMLLVGDRLRLSRHVEAALRFAPACALTALVLPEVLGPAGVLDLSLGNAALARGPRVRRLSPVAEQRAGRHRGGDGGVYGAQPAVAVRRTSRVSGTPLLKMSL